MCVWCEMIVAGVEECVCVISVILSECTVALVLKVFPCILGGSKSQQVQSLKRAPQQHSCVSVPQLYTTTHTRQKYVRRQRNDGKNKERKKRKSKRGQKNDRQRNDIQHVLKQESMCSSFEL